jgi:hypothetical protein
MAKKGHKRVVISGYGSTKIFDAPNSDIAMRVDRMINATSSSQGQMRMLVKGSYTILTSTTSDVDGVLDHSFMWTTDEYATIIEQYGLTRVAAIKVDVYDVAPNVNTLAAFSTYHDTVPNNVTPIPTFAQVVDGSDAVLPPPGTGKSTLYWIAQSSNENGFVTTLSNADRVNFGGFRYAVGATPGGSVNKYEILYTFIVDCKSRI